ncbi:MAG: ribosome silencing factor, partial [Firmicutes bacterium]|nr:ribosome silencing factor [Bacillota bacterium]
MINDSAQRSAKIAALAADDKKAEDIQVLKMPEIMVDTEYFVICSASSQVQIRAIVGSITAAMEDEGYELLRHEGRGGNNWVLLDYGN